MYYRALDMLANHHYRLPVRRFILELFDVPLNRETVESLTSVGEHLRRKALESSFDLGGRGPSLPGFVSKAATAFLGALDGELSEEDDESETGEENGTVIPLQIFPPLLSVRGFLIS